MAVFAGRRIQNRAPLSPVTFLTPQLFSACKAVSLRDAGNADISDSNKVIMKLHVNWGHASANQLRRVLLDSEGGYPHLVNFAEAF